jgi:hypothetical protein
MNATQWAPQVGHARVLHRIHAKAMPEAIIGRSDTMPAGFVEGRRYKRRILALIDDSIGQADRSLESEQITSNLRGVAPANEVLANFSPTVFAC